ncbi:filamin-B isoform X2 [Bombus vosnesenskii]|uniref:Filamin-B isoform X2 n=2 Tax=Pyrobombus TaxID=144703 RepID=A0A6J3KJ63_9HYME|nr:filamin-B isoform X2 [Bombus impatiens]XP_033351949.1 filamin-B isoform X2 [Bombus vosnesenskii]
MESTEQLRPEELVGLVARSAEGTAAKGMPIKGHEDLWVEIQANTFRNWVNEHLKHAVDAANGPVIDLVEDFRDGTRLCALVEVLTKRRLPRWNPRPANQHHHLENVSTALQAIEADGVKLVNIGNVDIVNGNLKLILGLIWSLIVRYQIGKSKFPPRKLMLAWLKTVLPECRVNNFTTDWNSGVYLSALLDYCQPGLFPHWRRLDPNDSVYNCRKAMEISKREFDIPMVLEPEYLASPYLDELSGMTYLSYFMKEGSPGFHATLRWVNSQLSHPVQNFTTDWNDGRTLCSIVRNLGGPAPVYDKIDTDPSAWEHNIQMGIDGGKKLGVEPILKAKDMADQNVEHLGVMAYAANFQWVKPRPQASKQIVVHIDSTSARVQQPAHFKLEILTKEVNTREVRGEVINPSGRIECRLTWNGIHGKGTFIPTEVGMHKLMVYNDGELVDGCPYYFRVLPPLTKIKSPGMDPCAIGSIVEVLVNSYGTSHDGIDVTAWSPTGRSLSCPVKENDGVHTATFQPDETGEWSIAITHKGNHIQGGPFTCFVFDPNGVKKLSTSEYNISQKYNNESHNTRTQTHGILKNKNNNYYKSADTTDGITERYINSGISTSSSTQARDYELASGSALETLPIHRPATFIIDQSIDPDKVTVSVSGPNGKIIPVQKSTLRGLTYTITAEEVGEHIIQILVNGQHIQGSPFRSQAYNARGIQIGNIPNGIVNQPVEFEIDGSNAGSGNLEILVNGGHVTSFVRALGSQRFLASFVPHEAVVHLVEMTFNGEVVPGSPWRVGIMPAPKMSVIGDSIRLVPAGSPALFELSALGFNSNEIDVQIITPSKRHVPAKIDEESGRPGEFRVEFTPIEVGSHLVEVTIAGQKLPAGPLVAKVYNSSLIQVTDVPSAVVGHACQFRVDASAAGEGQLEISINEGEVPNHVQVVGGGRCLVSFTPEIAKSHYIDIKFNGEAVKGCPFICNVSDTSRVTLSLNHLELIPVDQPASFHMGVDGSGSAELAVSVRGPNSELPVKVTGDIKSGFTAEFIPRDVGVHSISVEYNGHPVNGTPFLAKAFNADKVLIGPVARGSVGQPTHFTVDASQAGEGNLEITISARSQNIPTQVTPQGNARFSVSFVPFEACEHIINIAFNKRTVPGCPIVTRVGGDSHVTVSGQALSSAGLGRQSYLTVSNVAGSLEDLEVNVEGPNGQAVPAQVTDNKDTTCSVAFTPRVVGEHRISVSHRNVPVIGSPFSCKVYDVTAIKVKDSKHGVIGMPVTFLVETSQAGPGNLEVTVNGGRVPTSAQAQGPHTYAISFTPREPIVHTVDLRFNGEDVPGSPFSCQVSDTAKVIITEGLEKVSVNRLTTFTIEADSSLGTPTVEVLSPTRESLPIHVKQSGHGCYTAGFTPKDVGDHSVEVKINGLHVEGSPFLVKAYNADKVKVTDINSGVVGKPVFFSINASQAGAGNLEIIVAVNGKNVPNYVQSEGNAKFRVNFKPQEAAVHSLSVRFNGEPVPGSPFSCKVVGAGQAIITGHNLKMGAVKQLISFIIDPQAPSTNCDVIVTPPSNISLPITIEPIDGKYNISFVPMEVGRHNISILVDNEHVKGSPFACNVYDVTKVHVSGLSEALLGQATTFTVDAAEAGEGTLELVVSTDNNTVKAEVVACARGLYDVTFVPQTTSTHYVNISFNDDNVPGSPFKCPVISTMLDGPSMIRVGNTAYMDLEMPGLEGPVSAEVTGPDGIIIPCTLTKLSSNLYRVEIRTRQVGTYSVIFSDGHKIISSQTLQAFDPGKVTIKEVSDVVCHRPGTILVVAPKEAGPGKLTVNVRAAGADVDSVVREGENGQYDIMFHPTRAAPHKIHIKYNEVHILGSPLDVTVRGPTGGREVTATGLGLYQSCVGKVTSFTIETLGSPGKEFDVVISGPQGNAVPVRCYQHRDGNLLAEFTTNTVGTYKIDVLQGTKPVLGSPFFCQAFDISKVKLQELGPMIVSVHDHIAFKIIKTDAGMADLDVVATSPLGQELPLQVTPLNDGAEMVEFSPSVPGTYMINITYGGCPIPDSPLICTVDAAGQARAKGEGLLSGHADKTAHFIVTGTRSPPAVQVDGPDSVSKAIIEAGANPGTWNVSYVPTEVGVFDIRVVSAGQQLPGSPWHPKIIDTRNLRVIGGWPAVCDDVGRLKLHPSNKISFDTAEAGPGELTGKIGEHMLSFEMTSNNRLKLIPPELNGGEHRLEILFNGIPFPGAPKLAIVQDIEPPIQDTSRVLLRGRGLTSAKCGEEVSFTIDGSQAGTGTPKVQLFSPTSELNVMLQHLGDSVYRASYIPLTPDPLLMTVSWNGRQLKGCPLQINVTSAADASRVICSGDGLKHGIVGQEIRSFIDTRRAGPGELTAHCVGPHKVAYCELYDHGDATFTLNVKPQEAGRHALTIKYAGEHVPGSPFTLRVSGAPDASKVRVYGPGIEHGVLATFQSRFICDTRGAGAGQLTVRVRGPKGAFRVEMQRETQKDRIILCRYDPTEPGDYRVEVRWAGVLVPGSPFPVKIVDTQDELLMLTQSGDNYSTGHHTIASWRGSQAIL